jgi:hypothetical protein
MSDEARWEDPASPDEIAWQVRAVVDAIEKSEAPADAGITHFGLHMTVGTEDVNISSRGQFLQVTVYRICGAGLIGGQPEPTACPTCGHTKHPSRPVHPGYSKGVHDKRMRALADAFGVKVQEHWNGEDNHDGISVVLQRPCPPSLMKALARGPTSPVDYGEWAERVTGGAAR